MRASGHSPTDLLLCQTKLNATPASQESVEELKVVVKGFQADLTLHAWNVLCCLNSKYECRVLRTGSLGISRLER